MKEITIKIKTDDFKAVYKITNYLKLEMGDVVEVSSVDIVNPSQIDPKKKTPMKRSFSLEGKTPKERSEKVGDLMKNLSEIMR